MTDTLRKAAQDLFDECLASDFNEHWDSYKALRAALAQPEDVMVRFSRINQEMDGLLHDKAHTDTGKTRAAQSVRTPEMSYRPGSLPMEDKPVAWGMLSKGVIVDAICPKEHDREEGDYTVALYRRPQVHELPRYVIGNLADKYLKYQEGTAETSGVYEFVDAIIREYQNAQT